MKHLILTTILVTSGFVAIAQEEQSEPKSSYVITINGKEYTVQEGTSLELKGKFKNPEIKIEEADFKTFDCNAFSFNFPSGSAYQYDADAGSNIWTLDYNDFTTMIFDLSGDNTTDDLLGEMTNQFGEENSTVSYTSRTLGGKKLEGKRLDVDAFGQQLSMEFLKIEVDEYRSVFLIFQYMTDILGLPDPGKEVVDMIDKTIKFK